MAKLIFEDFQDEAIRIIAKRKNSWTLSSVAWEDVEQILLIRLFMKFYLYDQTQRFENWANRTVSNTIKNLLRDNCYKFQRPCLKCAFNHGNESCGYTSNNIQCNKCPLYADWEKKKKSLFNIKSAVSIENHVQTVGNIPSDFIDIESAKQIIDKQVLEALDTQKERQLYRLFYIKKVEEPQIQKILEKQKITEAYLADFQKKTMALARLIIAREDLA